MAAYRPVSSTKYYVFCYTNETEYKFDTVSDMVEFINVNRLPETPPVSKVSLYGTIQKAKLLDKTGLFRGFGVASSSTDTPITWASWKENYIICSRYSRLYITLVFRINDRGNEFYVFGTEELSRRYPEFKTIKDVRTFRNSPHLSITILENLVHAHVKIKI